MSAELFLIRNSKSDLLKYCRFGDLTSICLRPISVEAWFEKAARAFSIRFEGESHQELQTLDLSLTVVNEFGTSYVSIDQETDTEMEITRRMEREIYWYLAAMNGVETDPFGVDPDRLHETFFVEGTIRVANSTSATV